MIFLMTTVSWFAGRAAKYDRATRLPEEFVSRQAALDSEGFHVWRDARAGDDFDAFAPTLQKQVDILREEAELQGFGEQPYDYLLDKFDPGMTEADVTALFSELRKGLVPFVQRIVNSPVAPRLDFLEGLPADGQDRFLRDVVKALGFDFERGRHRCGGTSVLRR